MEIGPFRSFPLAFTGRTSNGCQREYQKSITALPADTDQWQERAEAFEKALASFESDLASNNILPDAQAAQIEYSILPDIKREEYATEQEMERLQAQLADLQSRKDTFTRLSNACRKLISPIRRLPADLLLEVFKIRFAEESAENSHAGHYRLFHINEGPWVFSHVCADWRRAMLSFPSVWSNFLIDRAAPMHHYMYYLELVLERSQAHPLDFSFALLGPGAMPMGFDHDWNEMLTALIPLSSQWRNIALILNSKGIEIMAGVSPLALPVLAKIDLTFTHFTSDTELAELPLSAMNMLCHAPKLVDVALEGIDTFPVTSMYLPLAQLRRLAIKTDYGDEPPDFPQLQRDIDLIQACPSLTSFDMSYYRWTDGHMFLAEQVITHKTISSFRISDTALLRSFSFPALVDLSIKPHDYEVTAPAMGQDVYVFLGRTQCKLQKLSFKNLNCVATMPSDFYAILRDFGNAIIELCIDYDGFYSELPSEILTPFWSEVFTQLVVDPAAVVLPALESFNMTSLYQDITPWKNLADFIESRWVFPRANVARLKKVVFGVADSQRPIMYISPASREKYERFKEEGLDMEIWTRTRFPHPKEPKRNVVSAFGGEVWQCSLV